MVYLAPVLIVAGWLFDWILDAIWDNTPALHLPARLPLALAIADLDIKTGVYGGAAWLLCSSWAEAGRARAIVLAVVLVLMTLEWTFRWWTAAWGDSVAAIADALGLGVRGYAFIRASTSTPPSTRVRTGPVVAS